MTCDRTVVPRSLELWLEGNRDRDGVGVGPGSRGRLRWDTAEDGEALSRTGAGRGNGIRANRVTPIDGPGGIAEKGIVDRGATAGHFAGGDSRAPCSTGVQTDIVRGCVGALNLERGCLVDVRRNHASAAKIERCGANDRARGCYGDLDGKG